MSEIVKVQRPLMTNAGGEPCIIYDSKRDRQQIIEFTRLPAHIRRALDGYPKVFCIARWKGHRWDLGQVIEQQPW